MCYNTLPGETRVAIVRPILKICKAEVPEAKKHLFCLVLAWHPSMLQSQHRESYNSRSKGALWPPYWLKGGKENIFINRGNSRSGILLAISLKFLFTRYFCCCCQKKNNIILLQQLLVSTMLVKKLIFRETGYSANSSKAASFS